MEIWGARVLSAYLDSVSVFFIISASELRGFASVVMFFITSGG
jgi:hypothetical protein